MDVAVIPVFVVAGRQVLLGRLAIVRNTVVVAVARIVELDNLAEDHRGVAARGVCLAVFGHRGNEPELPFNRAIPNVVVE